VSLAASGDPIAHEAAVVSRLADLQHAMAAIGAMRLLYGENPLLQLIAPSDIPGALRVSVAHATLTRYARHRERRRQMQVRSHNARDLWRRLQ